MKKIKSLFSFNNVLWVLFYLFLFSILFYHSFTYLDPDFGWHLQVGKNIALFHSVPHQNIYNYTFTGNWVDHEWLSNFLLYKLYTLVGYIGISIIFSLIIVLAFALLTLYIKKKTAKAPILLIMGVELFGLVASSVSFGVRIQEIGVLFLIILLFLLYLYQKNKDRKYLLFLSFLLFIWANLHASFLIGLFLFASYIAIQIFKVVIKKIRYFQWIDFSDNFSRKQIIELVIFFFFAFSLTLMTPYKFGLYSFLSGYGNTFYLSHIQEWLSQFHYPFNYPQLSYLAIIGASGVIYLAEVFYYRKRKINLWDFFIVSLFFVLSFKSRRHFPLFFIVSSPFLINNIVYFLGVSGNKKVYFNKWYKAFFLFSLFLITMEFLLPTKITNQPFNSYCDNYPCQAVKFLKKEHKEDMKLFNNYTWGGFLIWTYPEEKLFIDGRLPQVQFAGWTFLQEYLSFFNKDKDPEEKLDEYGINTVLLKAKDKKIKVKKWEKFVFMIQANEFQEKNYLREYLKKSNKWKIVYQDNVAIIFYRK